jgi:hypothetical protein
LGMNRSLIQDCTPSSAPLYSARLRLRLQLLLKPRAVLMRRRDFLMSIMATTGLSVLPARLRATRLRSIGVQLFSVREELQKDPDGVLKRLATIGFREVEVWLPPMSDLDIPTLRMLLDRHGLKATSRHWSNFTPEGLDGMLRESKILGNRYLIVTTLPADQRGKLDSYKRASEWFNSIGRSAHDRGIQFGFHTERWDFRHSTEWCPSTTFSRTQTPRW